MENQGAPFANDMTIKLVIKRGVDAPTSPPLDEKTFSGPIVTIGSDSSASLSLNAPGIAPEQAIIINEDGHVLLINRADGTILNGEALPREARRPLAQNDRLSIGAYVIIFSSSNTATHDAPPTHDAPSGVTRELSPSMFETMRGDVTLNATQPFQPNTQASAPQSSSSPTGAPPNGEANPPRNFAAILDSLRTEEDSFYFLIEGGPQNGRRIPLENAETPLGWDETGQNISLDARTVVAARALLRKDWSGVLVHTEGAGMVAVNGEPVETSRRLRNGDRLMIVPTMVTAAQNQSFLVFHEPASLLVLDSLLPQKFPPPVAPEASAQTGTSLATTQLTPPAVASQQRTKLFDSQRRVLGYFSVLEVLIMIIGTLVMATIVFLVLEYS
jgi:predicted component of type VI protein secretion system